MDEPMLGIVLIVVISRIHIRGKNGDRGNSSKNYRHLINLHTMYVMHALGG